MRTADEAAALMDECTSKKRYSTEELARKVARRCMAERPGRQLRVYACEAGCGGYHMTSARPR